MTERKRVEIDLEHYQVALMRLNAAMREIKPAFSQMNEAVKELNLSLHHFYEAVQARPEGIDPTDIEELLDEPR